MRRRRKLHPGGGYQREVTEIQDHGAHAPGHDEERFPTESGDRTTGRAAEQSPSPTEAGDEGADRPDEPG